MFGRRDSGRLPWLERRLDLLSEAVGFDLATLSTLAPVVAEIRAMKARIASKPEVQRHGERQLKLGPGGIRDVEFAVQLLQIVHGRSDRSLRSTGTLPALRALARGGYVADDDAEAFATSYRLLRTAEHRLQLAHERRTHTIPDDPERQEWLARSLGYRPSDVDSARAVFRRDLTRAQARVSELHAKLFFRPLLETYAEVPPEAAGVSLPTEQLQQLPAEQRAQLEQMMKQMGVGAPRTQTDQSCINEEDLDGRSFRQSMEEAGEQCDVTEVSSTSKRQEFTFRCNAGGTPTSGRMQIEVINDSNVRGTMEASLPQGKMDMKFEAKWQAAACGDVE